MESLSEIIAAYARVGIKDWGDLHVTPKDMKDLVVRALGGYGRLAETEADIQNITRSMPNGLEHKNCKFVPMPAVEDRRIWRCFFLPLRIEDAPLRASFDLFIMLKKRQCLGFRFEPADPPSHAHCYGHVQMNVQMVKRRLVVREIPEWLPDDYPAFPLFKSDPIDLFLSLSLAAYGYGQRFHRLCFNRICAGDSTRCKKLIERIQRMLS